MQPLKEVILLSDVKEGVRIYLPSLLQENRKNKFTCILVVDTMGCFVHVCVIWPSQLIAVWNTDVLIPLEEAHLCTHSVVHVWSALY